MILLLFFERLLQRALGFPLGKMIVDFMPTSFDRGLLSRILLVLINHMSHGQNEVPNSQDSQNSIVMNRRYLLHILQKAYGQK